jgi:AcrR family transcriptional regulator
MAARRRPDKPPPPEGKLAPGRPRSTVADRRILEATVALLSEVGIEQTTVSAVIARSGVARATVYRRWPTRQSLIDAALSQVKGRPPIRTSGDIEEDLARAVEQARAVFAEPAFQAFLPVLIRDLLRDRSVQGVSDTFDRVAPNLRRLAAEYLELSESAGLRPEVDPIVIGDILTGSVLMHLLSTGRPASRATAAQIVDVLLNGLRRRDGAATDPGSRSRT